MEGSVVTCPLVPSVPHLRSGYRTPACAYPHADRSPRIFGLGFLQTSPHDDALALLLSFGSANTWCEDFQLTSYVPCLAHTTHLTSGRVFLRSAERGCCLVPYNYSLNEFNDTATEENSRDSCLSTVTKGTFRSFATAINSQS